MFFALVEQLRTYIQQLKTQALVVARSRFWRHLLKASWVIVSVSSLMLFCEYAGWLERFETAGIDVFDLLQARRDPTHVVIVGIDDDDYSNLFKETSPLESNKVQQIIQAIALGKPSVIGIDLDTSSGRYREMQPKKEWPPLVWAEHVNEVNNKLKLSSSPAGEDLRNGDRKGVAELPQDSDGIIRRYHREFRVEGGDKTKSFPWAVVTAFCTAGRGDCNRVATRLTDTPERSLLLNFSGERFDFSPLSAHYVLAVAHEVGWANDGPFHNKIVLLGGFFRAGRDIHITPVGKMAGVQLMAQAVETELRGGGIRPLNEAVAIILDILAGTILVWFSYRFQLATALLLSLLAIPLFSLTSSYLAFSSLARWFNFVPVIVGVLIHELYHHAREYHHLLKSRG